MMVDSAMRSEVADPIVALLAGRYIDRQTGDCVGIDTRSIVIETRLAGNEADLVKNLGFGRRIGVVSDAVTSEVLGGRVVRALQGSFETSDLVLPGTPVADAATAEAIRAATAKLDALVAVGSGTINDLTKYASALDGKPYAVFATAPSMNGYVSRTASISLRGQKLTLPAQVPAGAFFDLEVLARAPGRMIRAGLGDSICRATAQTDWLLSHLLLDTPYRQLPFDLLSAEEPTLLESAADLLAGDEDAVRTLVRTLVLSGLGTAIVGSSAPASQAEHLISHHIDMFEPAGRPQVFHGEQVGVATLSVARLHEAMFERPPRFSAMPISPDDVARRFGDDLATAILPELSAKAIDAHRADELNHRIDRNWTRIVAELSDVHLPSARLQGVLAAAGAPLTPREIYLERLFYETALKQAREIRNRFTVLDVLASDGRLDNLVPTI